MDTRRYALTVGARIFLAALFAAVASPSRAAGERSVAILPVVPTGDFDPDVAAEFESDLVREMRANPANQVIEPRRVETLLGRPLEEVAQAVDARYVLASTIDKDIDAVSLRWELYDATAGKVVERGVGAGDIDNMVFFPLEVAVGLNILLDKMTMAP
jgi:TolB-like protein